MSAPPAPPRIDGYVYRQAIGSGGNSYVYLFVEDTPFRDVAVKMPKTFGPDSELRDRFKAEANAMARFGTEKPIVPVLAYREAVDGTPCLVMAYYGNGDLGKRVKTLGRLDVAEVLTVGRQMAEAVAAAHEVGLLHQDIKPANVLIAKPGASYRLGDFGIARQLRHGPGTYAFSLSWAAPEVVGDEDATERSDIYSLGATLWHLLSGSPPFVIPGGDNSAETLKERIIRGRLSRPAGREDVPDELTGLLMRMMATDPRGRPASAEEVLGELARIGMERTEGVEATIRDPRKRRGWVADDPRPPQPGPTPSEAEAEEDRTVLRTNPDSGPSTRVGMAGSGYAYEESRSAVAQGATVTARTVLRAAGSATDTMTEQQSSGPDELGAVPRHRRGLLLSLGAIALVIVGIAVAIFATGGTTKDDTPRSSGAAMSSSADKPVDPGAPQGDGPPGPVAVAAARTGAATLHFSWTYSASLASDTFQWRTSDGKRTGTAVKPALDLPDPAGTSLCIEIKVVRLDGSDGDPDWSQPGCGQ